MTRGALLMLATTACGWSEDHFLARGIPAFCDAAAACVGAFDAAACQDNVRAVDRSTCDYDPAAARECAKALDDDGGTECVDNGDLATYSFRGPEACDRVWDGCGPLFPIPIDEGTSPPAPTE